jgi:hypothetical protein
MHFYFCVFLPSEIMFRIVVAQASMCDIVVTIDVRASGMPKQVYYATSMYVSHSRAMQRKRWEDTLELATEIEQKKLI